MDKKKRIEEINSEINQLSRGDAILNWFEVSGHLLGLCGKGNYESDYNYFKNNWPFN